MITRTIHLLFLALVGCGSAVAQQFSAADSLRGQLTPLRTCYDVHFYELDVAIDPEKRSIAGSNAIHLIARTDFDRMQVDLFSNMVIDSIIWRGRSLSYTRRHHAVFVSIPSLVRKGDREVVTVHYHGLPTTAKSAPWDGGFVWQKDSRGKHHIGVACEELGASSWWPNKDHLSDEPDSMRMHFTAPNGLMAVGNGQLITRLVNKTHTRWTWGVRNPINNYNVSVNIGDFAHLRDHYFNGKDSLQLNYYVLRENLEKARSHFQQVKPMLGIFEAAFGPYPFYEDGYALIETPYAGMEHQSGIAYGNKFMKGYLGRYPDDMDFDYIIIHETGHEWWGNSVSMNDIADMWVHESFCTYAESVFVEGKYGYDKMIRYLIYQKDFIGNDSPILGVEGFNAKGNGRDMYYKGAWMLHTLRSLVNDDERFKAMLKAVATEFRHRNVDGRQVIAFINQYLGMNLDAFFGQYLKQANLPALEFRRSQGALRLKWKAAEKGFVMPIEFTSESGRSGRATVHADKWVSVPMSKSAFRTLTFRHDRFLFTEKRVTKDKESPKF